MTQQAGIIAPRSNQATWTDVVEVVDDDTGSPIDLTSALITLQVRIPDSNTQALTATVGSGITIVSLGNFQFTFARTAMQNLDPGTYDVGCVVTLNGETDELFIATVNILDGIVSQ